MLWRHCWRQQSLFLSADVTAASAGSGQVIHLWGLFTKAYVSDMIFCKHICKLTKYNKSDRKEEKSILKKSFDVSEDVVQVGASHF